MADDLRNPCWFLTGTNAQSMSGLADQYFLDLI
jgi:hypothetical protein